MTDLAVLGMRFETVGADAANRQLVAVQTNSGRAERASDALAGSMRRTETVMASLGRGLGLLGVATGVSAAFLALRTATLEYASSLREVSTLVDTTKVSMDDLSAAAIRQAGTFNSSALTQTKALYQIISAGASTAAQATDTLTAANMLAVGGVTTVTIAADGLTSVMNAYGDKVESATAVSDAMFVAVRAGKTTIAELSSNLGTVAPLAAQTGVSFDELAAATSALTKGGISTGVAITGLRAILAAVAKPSSEAEKLAKALGLEFNSTALASKGLAGFMEELAAKTGGNTDALAVLFGGVEALVPVMALSGQAGKDFASILDQMGGKAGSTGDAFDKIARGPAFQLGVIFSTLAANAISVGTAFAEALTPALTTVAGLLTGAEQPSIALDFALKAIAVTAGVTATVALYQFVASVVASGIAAITGTAAFQAYMFSVALVGPAAATAAVATTALGAAIDFALGPIGWAIIAIGALAAAWTYLAGESSKADKAMTEAAQQAGAGGQVYLQLRDAAIAAANGNGSVGTHAAGAVAGMTAALSKADRLTRQMRALGIETEYAANKLALLELRKAQGRLHEEVANDSNGPQSERRIIRAAADLNVASAVANQTAANLRAAMGRHVTSAGGGDSGAAARAGAAAAAAAASAGDGGGRAGRSAGVGRSGSPAGFRAGRSAGVGRSGSPAGFREVMDPAADHSLQPINTIVQMLDPLKVVADELGLIDGLAQDSARGMASAFGDTGRALGDLLTTMTGYQSRLAKIAVAESDHKLNAAQADRERASAQVQSYGDMLGAAKGFFKEGSDGYKALQAAEQAYRAVQFAMSVQAMLMGGQETAVTVGQNLIKSASHGVVAVARALASLPFPFNLAAGAATIAALAAIGVRIAGGGHGGGGSAGSGTGFDSAGSTTTARQQAANAQAGRQGFANAVGQSVNVKVTADRDGLSAYVVGTAQEQARGVAGPMIQSSEKRMAKALPSQVNRGIATGSIGEPAWGVG